MDHKRFKYRKKKKVNKSNENKISTYIFSGKNIHRNKYIETKAFKQ